MPLYLMRGLRTETKFFCETAVRGNLAALRNCYGVFYSFSRPNGWGRLRQLSRWILNMTLGMLRGALVALATLIAAVPAATPAFANTEAGQETRAKLIQYEPGSTDLGALAAEADKTVVFFFATWCPNCILTLSELSQNWSEVESDITLVIADYDTETELKSKYGVTYQDTFVLLDSKANGVKLWNAGGIAGLNANTR